MTKTFFELGGVMLIGTYDAPTAQIPPPYTLEYRPYWLSWGQDSFRFTLTNCPGDITRYLNRHALPTHPMTPAHSSCVCCHFFIKSFLSDMYVRSLQRLSQSSPTPR